MYEDLTEHIQQAAYFQWEETGGTSALEHWYCVEDIACFLESGNVLTDDGLTQMLRNAVGYEDFVREIAYRLSFYSGGKDAETNWYSTEQLLRNSEWRRAIIRAAEIYSLKKDEPGFLNHVRSEKVREYYRKL